MKALVVFYSLTGTTKQVAQEISSLLDCDIEEVIDLKARSGPVGFLSGSKDALTKTLTGIKQTRYDPGIYDIVIIGTPVWAFTMAPAIRTYINAYRHQFKKVAFFLTVGRLGAHKTFSDMQALCSQRPKAELEIYMRQVKTGDYFPRVKEFCDKIRV